MYVSRGHWLLLSFFTVWRWKVLETWISLRGWIKSPSPSHFHNLSVQNKADRCHNGCPNFKKKKKSPGSCPNIPKNTFTKTVTWRSRPIRLVFSFSFSPASTCRLVYFSSTSLRTDREVPFLWFWHLIVHLGADRVPFISLLHPNQLIHLDSARSSTFHLFLLILLLLLRARSGTPGMHKNKPGEKDSVGRGRRFTATNICADLSTDD